MCVWCVWCVCVCGVCVCVCVCGVCVMCVCVCGVCVVGVCGVCVVCVCGVCGVCLWCVCVRMWCATAYGYPASFMSPDLSGGQSAGADGSSAPAPAAAAAVGHAWRHAQPPPLVTHGYNRGRLYLSTLHVCASHVHVLDVRAPNPTGSTAAGLVYLCVFV